MSYSVRITAAAMRSLAGVPKDLQTRLRSAIGRLGDTPRPPDAVKLRGQFEEGWRIRVGAYRILYTVDDRERTVTVFRVAPRKEAYR